MSEVLRSFAGRLREYLGNRRRAPRYNVKAKVTVSIPQRSNSLPGKSKQPSVAGYTRDVSSDGLAVIIPSIRIGGEYLTGSEKLLRLSLETAQGNVDINCRAARYVQLDEESPETGFLVGLAIETVQEESQEIWQEWLSTLSLSH
jgi:hypothetical protein